MYAQVRHPLTLSLKNLGRTFFTIKPKFGYARVNGVNLIIKYKPPPCNPWMKERFLTRRHSTGSPVNEAEKDGREKLEALGCDTAAVSVQPIVWGDLDSFQHVNNVRYVRFFESNRIKWMAALGNELGGRHKADALIKGRGTSLILKSIAVKFRRPVTYPDTLLVGHKPHPLPGRRSVVSKSEFGLTAIAYSLSQRAIVAEAEEVVVWYDYDQLAKCEPDEATLDTLAKRMGLRSWDDPLEGR